MFGVDGRVLRIAWTVFLAAGLLWLLYLVRGVVFVFILALLFAYVIWPLVAAAEKLFRRRVPPGPPIRLAALALVYPVLIGLAVLAGIVIAPQIAQESATLIGKVNGLVDLIEKGKLLEQVSARHAWFLPVLTAIREPLLQHMGSVVPYLQSLATELFHFVSNLWVVVLVPILAFFLLKDREELVGGVETLVTTPGERSFLRAIFSDVNELLAQYMRALIVLSLLSFAAQLIVYLVLGVPYALLLATVGGMLEFIPLVGPLTAAGTVLIASWLAGYPHLLWIAIFLGVWRLVQDYVNTPAVMGSGIELHPLAIIFGILAGAELAGIAGMFLSVPAMATLRILLRRGRVYFSEPQPGSAP